MPPKKPTPAATVMYHCTSPRTGELVSRPATIIRVRPKTEEQPEELVNLEVMFDGQNDLGDLWNDAAAVLQQRTRTGVRQLKEREEPSDNTWSWPS